MTQEVQEGQGERQRGVLSPEALVIKKRKGQRHGERESPPWRRREGFLLPQILPKPTSFYCLKNFQESG